MSNTIKLEVTSAQAVAIMHALQGYSTVLSDRIKQSHDRLDIETMLTYQFNTNMEALSQIIDTVNTHSNESILSYVKETQS
jgi:hypothetical protein